FLDENKSLILKIVESQNSGKLTECAESQAKLQRNLMYLAAIADSQPQPPSMHSQLASGGMMQAGAHYLQQQQAQQLTTQSLMAAARSSSMLYGQQQQQQSLSALQQQQAAYHSQQLGMSGSGGGSGGGLHMLQSENTHSAGTSLGGGFPDFGRGLGSGNKQEMGSSMSDQGRGGSSSGHGGDGGENLYLKSAQDGN
ncbi:GRF1-interacting factor 1, partial [Datura stramonium]|nr:GRF1-interacting factor 1 [Datura stramonium]